jgi:prepilin-type N-terminal cleavage/methylation domain-containing protein
MTTTLATGSKPSSRRGGFTLIELALVILILALIMALAAPSFVRSYRGALLSESSRAFATACQLARLRAVTQQQLAQLHLDLEQQVYWIAQVVSNVEEQTVAPATLKRVELGPRVRLEAVTASANAISGEKVVTINFYPNGTCDAGSVSFRARDETNVVTLALDPITGRAVPADEQP